MNKSHDQLYSYSTDRMRKQKYYANLTGGCGTARQPSQYVFLTPNLSDWYFSVYHDDMAIPAGHSVRPLRYIYNGSNTRNRMFRILAVVIPPVLLGQNARNSRLHLKIDNITTSDFTLSNVTQGHWNTYTNPYVHIKNIWRLKIGKKQKYVW